MAERPSRLERLQKIIPGQEKRIDTIIDRFVERMPDDPKNGQRLRYRPLTWKEMRNALINAGKNYSDLEIHRKMRDQRLRLEEWVAALDEEYPGKEYTFLIHQVIAPQILSARDALAGQPFKKRTFETYAPIPRLNREALGLAITYLQNLREDLIDIRAGEIIAGSGIDNTEENHNRIAAWLRNQTSSASTNS